MSDEEEPRISDLIDVLDKLITRLEEMRMHVIERIKHGAKNAKKEELDATLAEAAYQCLPDAVKLLLEAGADVNLRWDFDRTPLHIAALSNKGAECAEVAGILMRAGADVNAVDEFGMTPLHYAALFGNVEVAEKLVAAGADIDAVDSEGKSPLRYAVECYAGKYSDDNLRNRCKKIAKMLLNAGADVDTLDENSARALEDLVVDKSKIRIILKTKKSDEFTDYEAKVGGVMELSGYTQGGRDQVKQVIRRVLKAERPLPRRVEEIAANVVRHVLLWIEVYKVEGVAAGMTVELGEYSDITIYAALYYEAGRGWVAELRAVFDGFDGFTYSARHRVVKEVKLGRRLDNSTDLLLRELMKLARYAYNAYVEEDDDSPTSLRIWTP